MSELRSTGPNLVTLGHDMFLLGGPSDLRAKWTSENLNTLGVLGLASQRSFQQKTNKSHNTHSRLKDNIMKYETITIKCIPNLLTQDPKIKKMLKYS